MSVLAPLFNISLAVSIFAFGLTAPYLKWRRQVAATAPAESPTPRPQEATGD